MNFASTDHDHPQLHTLAITTHPRHHYTPSPSLQKTHQNLIYGLFAPTNTQGWIKLDLSIINPMALRIGLLILASCNLYHADLITTRLPTLTTHPVVSFPLDADSQDDRHDNDAPKLGQKLQPLGYNPPKE